MEKRQSKGNTARGVQIGKRAESWENEQQQNEGVNLSAVQKLPKVFCSHRSNLATVSC